MAVAMPAVPGVQCFMLTEAHREVLRKEYNVHPWHIEQVREPAPLAAPSAGVPERALLMHAHVGRST
jgi:hypothetical protein